MVDIQVRIDEEQIRRVNAVLYNMPGKTTALFRGAIQRGLTAGRKKAYDEAKERYDIKEGKRKVYETVTIHYPQTLGGEVIGDISFSGRKIPLYKFHPEPDYRVTTDELARVMKGGEWRTYRKTGPVSAADVMGGMRARPEGFIATFQSGHTGIFKRTGGKTSGGKEKIEEYWGFSIKDMLDYEPARKAILEPICQSLMNRMNTEDTYHKSVFPSHT